MGLKVCRKQCATCIYRKRDANTGQRLGWDVEALEDEVRDDYGGFASYRACHHETGVRYAEDGETSREVVGSVCCRGFWNRHRDEFQLGQIAQRLGVVEEV